MSGRPDPKPVKKKGNRARRLIDPAAVRLSAARTLECAACGNLGSNGHHVLPKDKGGDDVPENIVTLCGSGTARCHGAHHGNPYVVRIEPGPRSSTRFVPFDERRDAEWVNRRIGFYLHTRKPEAITYILEKLGDVPGRAFLERVYFIDLG